MSNVLIVLNQQTDERCCQHLHVPVDQNRGEFKSNYSFTFFLFKFSFSLFESMVTRTATPSKYSYTKLKRPILQAEKRGSYCATEDHLDVHISSVPFNVCNLLTGNKRILKDYYLNSSDISPLLHGLMLLLHKSFTFGVSNIRPLIRPSVELLQK